MPSAEELVDLKIGIRIDVPSGEEISQQDLLDVEEDVEKDNQLGAEFVEQIKIILLACVEQNKFDD